MEFLIATGLLACIALLAQLRGITQDKSAKFGY